MRVGGKATSDNTSNGRTNQKPNWLTLLNNSDRQKFIPLDLLKAADGGNDFKRTGITKNIFLS